MDECIYLEVGVRARYVSLFYLVYILLYVVKHFLSKNFDMKNMGDTSYVIGIQIRKERSRGIVGSLKRLTSIKF